MRGLRLVLAVVFLAVAVPARAEVTVRATINPQAAAVGEPVSYAVTVAGAGDVDTPQLGDLPAFEVQGTGKSTVFRRVNGHTSREVTFTFTLIPVREGEQVIEGTRVVADGDPYLVNRVTVTVLPASNRSRPQAPGATRPGFPQMPDPLGMRDRMFGQQQVAEGDVEIDTSITPDAAWVGQQVVLTFTLRRAVDLFSSPRYSPPETPGMRALELDPPPGGDTRAEVKDGRRWIVTKRRVALFPLASGAHEIGPAGLDFSINPFAAAQHLETAPITLLVKPLPTEGRPEFFDGAVGDFKFSARMDKTELRVADSVNLVVTVTGSGNLHDIRGVDLPSTGAFEVYEPEVADALINSPDGVQGTRTLTYVLVVREEGDQQIGPVRFAAFDPEASKYRTFSAGPFPVRVSAAPAPAPVAEDAPSETAVEPVTGGVSTRGSLWWALAAFAVGLALLALRRPPAETAASTGEYPEEAVLPVDPMRELTRLETAAGEVDDGEFVRTLDQVVRGALGERWALPAPQVDPGCAARVMRDDPEELRSQVVGLLEQLAALRFAPGIDGVSREPLLEAARRVVNGGSGNGQGRSGV
ncbi:MAG: BatD family protein [Nitrospirota bacterium]|nr:BatD family protein [Nitrospirota bacterium]